LAWDIRTQLSADDNPHIENIATAVIMIVVQDPNVDAGPGAPPTGYIKAFTSVLYDIAVQANALIAASANLRAIPLVGQGTGAPVALSYEYHAEAIAVAVINGPLAMFNANPDITTCTEKQIIARLFHPGVGGGFGLFRHIVDNLLGIANGLGGRVAITYVNIKAVILHIHTPKDPCAKCARLFAGVSRQMNMQPNGGAAAAANQQTDAMTLFLNGEFPAPVMVAPVRVLGNPSNLIANLAVGNARFLIEVSSNGHYGVNACLHAECSGNDGNAGQAKVITCGNGIINFNDIAANLLVIPNGVGAGGNWTFPQGAAAGQSFPPYVIFSRVGVTGIGAALPLNGNDCPLIPTGGNTNTHMHQIPFNNMPAI
jgi:hypothetical protein